MSVSICPLLQRRLALRLIGLTTLAWGLGP